MSDTKSVQDLAAALPSQVFRPKALTIVVAFITGAACFAGGLALAQSSIQKTSDAGVAPVAADLAKHKEEEKEAITAVKADVAGVKRQLEASEERSARRFEVLYNTILERRPQPGADELTKPQTDAGR